MNVIVIKGRLTKQPELRRTTNGTAACTVSVAVDRGYGDHKTTDFFDCVFWKQGAEFVSQYFTKGQEILVQGEMQSRQYQDKNGNNRISWEIGNAHAEFCGSKQDNQKAPNRDALSGCAGTMTGAGNFSGIEDDDELPF